LKGLSLESIFTSGPAQAADKKFGSTKLTGKLDAAIKKKNDR
jgi:hypothetical protein